MNYIDHIFLGRDAWVQDRKGEIVSVEHDGQEEILVGIVFYDAPLRGVYKRFKTDEVLFLQPDTGAKTDTWLKKKYGRVIINAWPEGKLIRVIKIIRAHTGMGLKDAKDIVDESKIHPVGISIKYEVNEQETYDKVRLDRETANKLFDELIENGVSSQIEETDE